MSVLCKELGSF